MSDLISIKQLATWLQVARGTIYNWVYQRRIPFIKIGRSLRFDPKEIEEILKHSPKERK